MTRLPGVPIIAGDRGAACRDRRCRRGDVGRFSVGQVDEGEPRIVKGDDIAPRGFGQHRAQESARTAARHHGMRGSGPDRAGREVGKPVGRQHRYLAMRALNQPQRDRVAPR